LNKWVSDTQWFAIDAIPQNAKKINTSFIAKSEQSGSVHVLCGKYDMYELEDGFCMDVKEECILNHTFESNLNNDSMLIAKELPAKDHRHSIIKPGKYFVGIQRRFDPLEKIMKKVID
jgi:hypothetical protein